MVDVQLLCKNAKRASQEIVGYSAQQKNDMLCAISHALSDEKNVQLLIEQNALDVALAVENGKDATFVDRLTLTPSRIETMIDGLNQIVKLADPVGEIVEEYTRPNGLKIQRVRAPLGVIGIIYEARPNVTVDAAALCLKSGNSVVLRGGKDAINSNRVLYQIMQQAIKSVGLNADTVCFIDDVSREASKIMLQQDNYVDVVIPRGGEGLKHFVLDNATMPVIASAGGNCHVYVEKTADLKKAVEIVVNAKTQRPSTCNTLEHLLVDKDIADEFIPVIAKTLRDAKDVEILGDETTCDILGNIALATEDDLYTEFLAYKLTICVVDDVKQAVEIINQHNTCHSEAIITNDEFCKEYFQKYVDAAAVYINASTRFTDGYEFGLGAEMGISTQKLHARGPIALKELTSVKYVVTGDGHIRK